MNCMVSNGDCTINNQSYEIRPYLVQISLGKFDSPILTRVFKVYCYLNPRYKTTPDATISPRVSNMTRTARNLILILDLQNGSLPRLT